MNRPFWGTTICGSPHKASLWSNSHQFFHLILPRNSQHLGLCFQKQQWWIDGACFKECSPISKWTVSDEPMSDCIGSLAFGTANQFPSVGETLVLTRLLELIAQKWSKSPCPRSHLLSLPRLHSALPEAWSDLSEPGLSVEPKQNKGFSSSSSTKSPISRQTQVCGCYLVAHIGNLL